MYDKYFTGMTFAADGSILPKHKGILIAGATSYASKFTPVFYNGRGGTFSMQVNLIDTPYIFPIELYSVVSLPSGLTGILLN